VAVKAHEWGKIKAFNHEEWVGMGPMTAVLSAYRELPEHHLLVIACDYPLLQKEDIEFLISSFHESDQTTAYKNKEGFIEPLLAVYQSNSLRHLSENFKNYNNSLKRFLQANDSHIIAATQPDHLLSIDTPDQYHQVLNAIAKANTSA